MSTSPGSKVEGSKGASSKSYIRHSTSDSTSGPWHQQLFVPANQSGKPKKNKSRGYKRKPQKTISYNDYEGFLSLMQGMLRRMDNMDKTCKPPPRVKQVLVKNDETILPLRGSGLT
jgi:hypothetical protein